MRISRSKAVTVALALVTGVFIALAAVASAKVVHEHESTFPLEGINWISVDNSAGPSSGDLYVAELNLVSSASRVYQTDATGVPTGVELDAAGTPSGSIGFFAPPDFGSGPAVDGSTGANSGRIYVPDVASDVVDLFGENGGYVCQITGAAVPSGSECAGATGSETPTGAVKPIAVAVDPTDGSVAVGDATGVIYLFSETGAYGGEIADSHITRPGSLAYDSSGRLYVVNSNLSTEGNALRYSPAGAFELELAAGAVSVAADASGNHVYLSGPEGTRVEEVDALGNQVSTFGEGGFSAAVNFNTDQVYVGRVARGESWSGPLFFPVVTTGEASGVDEDSATLSGTVDPEVAAGGSQVESCSFEYGPTSSYVSTAQCLDESGNVVGTSGAPILAPTSVHAQATIAAGAIYHYRLVAENEEGQEGQGEDRTFAVSGPPGISDEHSIAGIREATVKAQINAFGHPTTCEVQYVSDAAFQVAGFAGAKTVPCDQAVPGDFEAHEVSAQLGGLEIATTYEYRFVARNGSPAQGGITAGEPQAFSTFGIKSFSVDLLNEEGNPYVNAATGLPYIPGGGHPYQMRVRIEMATTGPLTTRNKGSVEANLRTVNVQLPPGLIGNPTATSRCQAFLLKPQKCPVDSQIGYGLAYVARAEAAPEEAPIFNLAPPRGVAAQLGGRFNNIGTVRINAKVRTGSDYGVDTDSLSITADDAVSAVELRLWGVPADEGHASERFCGGGAIPPCASGAPLVPFLTSPTACTGPLAVGLSVDSWQEPGAFVSRVAGLPAVEECGRLHFDPSITVKPDTTVTDSPSGLHVDLRVPQNQNPSGLAEANLKDAVVTLPAGVSIDPAGANGLAACSPSQIELHGPEPATCPDAAKIGTVRIDTPLVDHPLEGSVYVAQQGNAGAAHGSNPFGSLLAVYIAVADPETGVVVKLAGQVEADPATGRLTTTFKENPQMPFEDFKLDFFGGPRATLQTPAACGGYATTTRLTPWSSPEGADAGPGDSFSLGAAPGGGDCPTSENGLPAKAALQAGTVSPSAASYSPLVIRLTREDGTQRLRALNLTLPEGLTGRLAGTPYCPDAAIAQAEGRNKPGDGTLEQSEPSCPSASQVGTVDVAAGAGPSPLHVKGSAYLAGPYKGAPLSLLVVTPAVTGPFDLGAVVVRTPLSVNEETAQITAKSDPLPTILEGIPLDVRSVAIELNKPRFSYTPSSCEASAIAGQAITTTGAAAALSSRYQVSGCSGLAFKPRLALRVFGKTNRTAKPRLRAVLQMKPGEANIARAQVNLPHSLFLEQNHIKTVCTRVQWNEGGGHGERCPKGSIYGHAKAITPLLDKPLEGPVYLRTNGGERKLPDLVAALNGQIDVALWGKVDSGPNQGLRNTFEVVPDAPVTKFVLEMQGGKKGLLVNSENLCSKKAQKRRAIVRFVGHNGKVDHFKPQVATHCKKKGKGKPKH